MNNSNYIFGGFILTAGTLEDGNTWEGVNILIARPKGDNGELPPVSSTIVKAKRSDDLLNTLVALRPGAVVTIYFDERGKVALFQPLKGGAK